jgi:hypothetical protein
LGEGAGPRPAPSGVRANTVGFAALSDPYQLHRKASLVTQAALKGMHRVARTAASLTPS